MGEGRLFPLPEAIATLSNQSQRWVNLISIESRACSFTLRLAVAICSPDDHAISRHLSTVLAWHLEDARRKPAVVDNGHGFAATQILWHWSPVDHCRSVESQDSSGESFEVWHG
jgi:hypothetical protein